MLKVIKSNALFALVLLLSIPAYASQYVDTSKLAGFASRLREVGSNLAANAYQKLPSAQSLKAAGSAALAVAKRGAAHVGKQTAAFGQETLKRALPVAQASLAYAGQHSNEIKIASGTVAALGVTFAGYRAIKAVLARSKNAEKPVRRASLFKKKAMSAPAFKSPTLLLEEAKAAAEADIETLKTIQTAGRTLALRMKNASTAAAVEEVSAAIAQFHALRGSFRYALSNCPVPDEQAEALKMELIALCQQADKAFQNPTDCLNEEVCTALFGQLTALTANFDLLIQDTF
jgi:alkylated DNA nucleotide flippase Atl1